MNGMPAGGRHQTVQCFSSTFAVTVAVLLPPLPRFYRALLPPDTHTGTRVSLDGGIDPLKVYVAHTHVFLVVVRVYIRYIMEEQW